MSTNSTNGSAMIREIQRQQIREKLRRDQNAIGSNMIRDIQEQRRREESAEANRMIREIQAQQKLARHLMRERETRTRKKPPPSRRQINRATVRKKLNEVKTRMLNRKKNSTTKTKKKYTL